MNRTCLASASLACGLLLIILPAWAHKGSDAYLEIQEVNGEATASSATAPVQRNYRFMLAVAIKDLDLLLPLDANSDGKVTWGELKAALPSVVALANESVTLDASLDAAPTGAATRETPLSVCRLDWQMDGIDRRGDGAYVRLASQTQCRADQTLALRYRLLGAQDADHRLLVSGRVGGGDLLTTMSPQQQDGLVLASAPVPATDPAVGRATHPGRQWQTLRNYFMLGLMHLMEGYDHLAFLLALVLPLRLPLSKAVSSVVSAADNAARGSASTVRADGDWWALLRTVTAFTIGHSLTLLLATLGWTPASPSWVEPAIALTIAITALLNLRPLAWVRIDVLALLFGMVHGYGFASLLMEAAAPSGLLPWALAGFNLGVEAGQLIAVCGWVLLSQIAVGKPWYPILVVRAGSVLLVLLATWWFWQRVS